MRDVGNQGMKPSQSLSNDRPNDRQNGSHDGSHGDQNGRSDDNQSDRLDDRHQPAAAAELLARVYDELRRLARAYMRHERPGQTIQATALVHEAYMRLAGAGTPWNDERHFVGIAARSMRQILVDRARARGAQKRWGGMDRVSLHESLSQATAEDAMLPALDEALNRLEQIDPEQARIVELRFFAGLSIEETADALAMSPATIKRRWALARAWLFRELADTAR